MRGGRLEIEMRDERLEMRDEILEMRDERRLRRVPKARVKRRADEIRGGVALFT
jgi:hypothetical protein